MTPFLHCYFLYMVAILSAACCLHFTLSARAENVVEDGQQEKTPRHLDSQSPFMLENSATEEGVQCGGKLTARHGVVQTPGFPRKFPVPITCVWVIDASELTTGPNVSIVIYPTQLYVLSGLQFTEYMYYGDDIKVPSQRVFQFSEHNVTKVAWIQFSSQYLEISFTMKSLDGTHLRALDNLLDVYGFNITYEIGSLKPYQCNALKCRFLGHCFAEEDYSSYFCSCFPGYSGSDCGQGPLCDDPHQNVCENGGTCKQIGASSVTCLCRKGFKGNKCEIPEIAENLGCFVNSSPECQKLCLFRDESIRSKKMCRCKAFKENTTAENMSNRNGNWRYQVTMRFSSNLTAFYRTVDDDVGSAEKRSKEHLKMTLEKHVARVLRNYNFSDLELINNFTEGHDVTFHLYGHKSDSYRIHEAVSRMIERGRLGNYTLVSNFLKFRENPPLELEAVVPNQPSPVREGSEFILSCVARGSPDITFRWYKDGYTVNTSLATRDIWTMMLPPEQKNTYTSLLGVRSATRFDDGLYTCEATDWETRECRSVVIHVKTPPQLRIEPSSVTVYRGESLNIRCLSPENDFQRYGQLGYSWTRNGFLFQSNPSNITWEDLYPDGSILRIKSIQKSSEFTCIVSNKVAPISKSVHVIAIDRGTIELCPANFAFEINWPSSAPGPPIVMNCPKRFEGHAKRTCEQHDIGKVGWLIPDFSDCVATEIVDVYNEFQALTSGYQNTNCLNILQACLEYVKRRHLNFNPGEGSFLLDLLQEVEKYLQQKGTVIEREMASQIILHVLDKIIQSSYALNSLQHVKKFQILTQAAARSYETASASQLTTSSLSESTSQSQSASSSASLLTTTRDITSNKAHLIPHEETNSFVSPVTMALDQISSFQIFKSPVKNLPFNLEIYSTDVYSDLVNLKIGESNYMASILSANSSVHASIIAYKNLTHFLPRRYFARSSDGDDIDYIPASRIIASHLFQSNHSNDSFSRLLNLPLDMGHIEIIFQHENNNPTDPGWFPICGHDLKSTEDTIWRTDSCITKNLMENITRCICPLSGTFVVLLAKKNNPNSTARTSSRPIFVVISCGCCFLQSCTAFVILIPILYNRKCCITFLKMQFCTSTSTVMAIFVLGFMKLLPQDWHGIISSTLASLMLLEMSSLVAIALVVQSDLIPKKAQMANLSSGIRGAICVSWLLPILFAICSPLIYTIVGKWPLNWWLESGSYGFVLFAMVETLFVLLFIMLFAVLVRKLLYLVRKYDKQNVSLWRRIGLLYRTAVLVVLKTVTDILFLIVPSQPNNNIISHIFGVICILLGFGIIICFVVKAESSTKSGNLGKHTSKAIMSDVFSSRPPNTHLGFYTSHELDKNYGKIPSASLATTQLPTATPSSPAKDIPRKSVESFINAVVGCEIGGGGGCETTDISTATTGIISSRDKEIRGQDIVLYDMEQPASCSGSEQSCSKSRCCNILGKSNNKANQYQVKIVEAQKFFDPGGGNNMEIKDRKCKTLPLENREVLGVETLDILKGVSQDSIIGIRSCLSTTSSSSNSTQMVSQSSSNMQPPLIQAIQSCNNSSIQTSKVQKRVTIEEPKPSSTIPSQSIHHHHIPPPIITISTINDEDSNGLKPSIVQQQLPERTVYSHKVIPRPMPEHSSTSDSNNDDPIDGMLDRISHDLDYLLNGAVEIPTKWQPGCTTASEKSSSTSSIIQKQTINASPPITKTLCTKIQEVIIEESEIE